MDEEDDLPTVKKGKKVLLAIDGSKYSVEAFEWYAEELHKEPDTVILAYSADHQRYVSSHSDADDDSAFESPEDQTRKVFRAIDEIANRHRVKHMLQLLHEPLGESVIKSAKQQNVDMIIVGGRKHGKSHDMGITTNTVAFQSDIPVLIYKYKDKTNADNDNSKDGRRQRSESFSDKVKAMLKIH